MATFIIMASCNAPQVLTGTWKAGGYTCWEKGNASLHHRVLGFSNQLTLNHDSSWTMEGSCQVFRGSKWIVSADSLFLFPDTSWYVSNAPQKNKPVVFEKGSYLAYKIGKNKLEQLRMANYKESGNNDSLIVHPTKFLEILRPLYKTNN